MVKNDVSNPPTASASRNAQRAQIIARGLLVPTLLLAWPQGSGADAPGRTGSPEKALSEKIEIGTDDPSNRVRDAVVLIGGCTGTLVAADLVLTAAHCGFTDEEYADGGWHDLPSWVWVQVGPDRSAPLFTTFGTAVSLPPVATAGPWPLDDIALIRLETPVPASRATPRTLYLDHPAPLERYALGPAPTIFQVGYGGGRDRRIMTGGNYVDWLRDPSLLHNGFEYDATFAGAGIGDRGTNIEGGDSGGPMLLNRDTGPVMGVLSHWHPYGIATFGPGGGGRPSVRDWLRTWAPQQPDFDVLSVGPGGCTGTGGDPRVRVTILNRGTVTARGWIDVFTGLASAPTIGTYSTLYRMSNMIAPEGTQDLFFAIDTGFTTGWVDVLVDTTRSVAEQNESNNHGDAYVALPDCSFN